MSAKERVINYSNDELTVHWKPDICIHSEKCWRGLGNVFKPHEKRWVQLEGASNEEIMKQVDQCPSAALSYTLVNSEPTKVQASMKAQVIADGPILLNGSIEITNADGSVTIMEKTALCRCGASNNKPFCDGSHKAAGFKG